jgi:sugar (pentulose or hexulose) kinase
MKEAVIGIDIGTSYTKVSLRRFSGDLIKEIRYKSIKFNVVDGVDHLFAEKTWGNLFAGISYVKNIASENCYAIRSMCISAISPVLVFFSTSDSQVSLSMPYWYIEQIDGLLNGVERASKRIDYLRRKAATYGVAAGELTDLIGFLNYKLTGIISLNSITLTELCAPDCAQNVFEGVDILPPLYAVNCSVAMNPSSMCCAGGPDSFFTAFGAGAVMPGDQMIYLGTYGSLLQINSNLFDCLSQPIWQVPYGWVFSSPRFGATLERISYELFQVAEQQSLLRLDAEAQLSQWGAGGLIFHLPKLRSLRAESPGLGFMSVSSQSRSVQEKARALLESLPIALMANGIRNYADNLGPIYVAGGGASSQSWMQIIADSLGATTYVHCHGASAVGAARLAVMACDEEAVSPKIELKSYAPNLHPIQFISDLLEFARICYRNE